MEDLLNDIALFDLVAKLQLCYAIGGEAPASTNFEYPEMHFLESYPFLIIRVSIKTVFNLPLFDIGREEYRQSA